MMEVIKGGEQRPARHGVEVLYQDHDIILTKNGDGEILLKASRGGRVARVESEGGRLFITCHGTDDRLSVVSRRGFSAIIVE